MTNQNSITALLQSVEKKINELEEIKATVIPQNRNVALIQIIFKEAIEHLRSCFDYMALDICRVQYNSENKVYFVYGTNKKTFDNQLNKNFPNLENLNPKLYTLMKSVQPFESANDEWLIDLFKLTNTNKHNNLSEINSVEINDLNIGGMIRFKNCSEVKNVTIRNCTVDGVKQTRPIIINEEGQIVSRDPRILIYQTKLSELKLNDGTEITMLLKKCSSKARELSKKIYIVLDKMQNL